MAIVAVVSAALIGCLESSRAQHQEIPAGQSDHFGLLPPGAVLSTSEQCADRVRPAPEVREVNQRPNRFGVIPNQTLGVPFPLGWDDADPAKTPFDTRVDGAFTGTTDEIIQWAACKWGVDEDYVRAQIVTESWWDQVNSLGDWGTDPDNCEPRFPLGTDGRTGQCPESFGLGQTRYPYMSSAFPWAYDSSAYNLDVTYAFWRSCFEGTETWLNNVERGRQYAAGDMLGCMGRWFAGRWYTQPAVDYMAIVQRHVDCRTWESPDFLAYDPPSTSTTTSTTSTTPMTTTIAAPACTPSAPRALGAVRGNQSVTLTWNAPASDGGAAIVDYVVQRSADGGTTWRTVSDGITTVRRATVGGLVNGRRYYFRVAAKNRVGRGAWSAVVSAVPATTPSAPRSLTAAGADRSVVLSWRRPASNGGARIFDYGVQRSDDRGTTWRRVYDGVSTLRTVTVRGLIDGHRYFFRVAAKNHIGRGAWSAVVSAVPATTPSAPRSLTAAGADRAVVLSWRRPASNGGARIFDYAVQRSGDGGRTWRRVYDGVSTLRTVTVRRLIDGHRYFFRVAAKNRIGRGPWSAIARATPT